MNKSYRTVWNATTGTWAAAPETARMRTKSKSNSAMRSSVTAAVAVMAGVGGGAMSADANAQAANGNGTIGVCGPAGSGGRTFGYSGGFVNIPCVTTGGNPGADALYQGRAASFILTNDANQYGQGTGNTNVPVSSMAGITGSKNGHLVLLGGSGVHISGPADFNNNVNMTNHRINNLAAGVAGTDAVNLNQLNSAIAAAKTTANPYVVTNTGTYAAATAARAGGSATAVGANANASGISAVALGGNTVATGQNAVALGTLANATGNETVAVGVSARASGSNATAMGRSAVAGADNTVALGYGSQVDTANSVALGANARVIAGGVTGANSSIAIGNGAVAGGTNSIIIGTNAQHIGSGATVLGSNASAMGGSMGVAVGYNSSAAGASAVSVGTNALASGRNSVAMGLGASATSINSVALGYGATGSGEASTTMGTGALATGYHGVSLGANANSAGRDSVALGTNANAANTNSVALGNQSIANRDNSVSVGSSTLQRQITNLAAGTANTDAVNLGQMNAAISNAANPYVAVRGTTAANATGTSSIAIGDGAIARNTTTAAGQTNIAIGARANTSGGFGQLALGDGASTQNSAAGGAIAIGRGATTTQRGVALGDGASVTAQFGVALGDGSLANQENTVSVGNATTQRRIVNLAAGTGATDAVNVSQLTGVTKALGGGAAVGADGGITNPTYNVGGTDYHNVGDALDALAASGIGNPNAVIYDDATKSTVTLGGTGAAAPVALKNVADAKDDHDALNLGQLKDAGLVGDDGAGNLTSLAVTYDGTAKDSVTLGGAGATTPVALHNVADGVLSATSKDAVNGSQLFATNTRVGDLEDLLSKGGVIDPVTGESLAVVYDGNAKDTVTLAGTNGTTLSNVKAGVADMDAVNVSQLKDSGLIDPSTGKSIAAVTYDSAAKDSVTLGGASATTPVALHNVADGVLSATSKDAVNGSQLFATNQDLGNLKDSLKQGGVIDPVTGESLAVVYDGNAKDTVTLAGTNGTTLSNVKAGVADMDAVNVSQLKDSGLIDPSTGKSIAAVTYDRNADGTPNYGTVTLGNGAGPTQIKNVATGVDDTDAVNVKQLNTGLSDLEDRMSGGNLRFIKVNADPVTGTPAVASGALAVAIGSDARATSANSLALGSGARVTGAGSVAIGYNSVANQNNVVSVGDVGRERKIVNVADGDVAFQSTDAVNGGQLYAALNTLSTSVTSKTQQAIDTFSSEIDKKTQAAIDEVNSRSMQPMDVSDPLVAIEGLQGSNVASLNGADPTKATAAAIGSSTAASGANAVAVGLQSGAGSDNSVAIGSFAQTGAGQDYSVAVGSNVQTNGTQAVALGANAQANGDYALAVGNNGAQAIGDGSIAVGNAANVRAGSTNAIAIGTGANVARSVEGAMALGANATAGAANSIALGENAFSNRANALSIGRAGAERQIVNVAAGTQTTDAVNVSQLKGVTDSLGGGTTIGADGSITKPTYKVGGSDYHNVGDALDALASRTPGDPNAVAYDSAAKDTVTLGGAGATTPVALKNVADAKDDGDALNLGQLKDAGLVGDDGAGNLTSLAVTYDGASKDSVTLGGAGAATPVALHNVADGVLSATSKDAVNGSQLFATNENLGKLKDSLEQGGAIDPTTGESLAVVYDGKAKDAVTLGGAGATAPVALKNVADGTERHDAINLGQLQDAGLVAPVDPTDPNKGLTSLAVTYDGAAKDVVTLAGTNGTTLSNVKAGVADMDAVNVSQLKDAGLIDPSTGKPIAAVTYDSAAKDTVTLGGAGATTPVALKNVADAKDDGDALNLGQLKDAGLVGDDGTGNLTSLAVTYDAASKDSVTLGGAGAAAPVALHNVADGVLSATSKDAVNGSQLFTTNQNLGDLKDSLKQGGVIDPVTGESLAVVYDSAAKDSVTLGNAGTPVGIHNLAAGAVNATSNDAINGSQLFTVSKSVADKIGGGAGVGADGSITDPTYSVGGQDYHSVGDALGALDKNSGNNPLAVVYDGTAKDAVTLGGAGATTPVALKNVADAKDDGDALNLGQLKSAGLVGDDGTGNLTSAAVTYDKNADGTINHDKATLAGTNGTTLSNVKAGVADMDAVNVSQLKDAGLIDPSTGKSIAAVTYDSAAKDSVTLGGAGATTPVALKNVADAKDDGDALNLGQLKNAGLVGDDGTGNLTSAAMTYDKNADGTINHDKATLAGTNGTTLSNVKAGVADMDAVNVSQLKDAGLIDPSTGKSIAAVTYDSAAKDSVTLGGAGATTPVALKNVADAKDDGDALNLGQLKNAGLVGDDGTGNLTSAAVTYDKNADGTINHDKATLAGTNGTTLSNVKAGVADMDAVNVSQLKDAGLIDPSTGKSIAAVTYDSAAKDTVTLGGTGATTPVALKNVADGSDRHDAINLGQLQDAGLVAPVDPTDPGKGLMSLAVAYDNATQDVVTLKGANGTTITNVKAGAVTATSTDAINGAQLHGTAQSVADSLGGGSTVDADGKVTNPSYSLADPTDASKKVAYDNVGGALANLDGRTLTNTENITVINKQLGDSGLVDPVTGQSIAAVTYDRNADGTPNKGSVTLGGAGATTPVALKNVADGVDTHDAVNLGQLQNAGLVAPVDPTNPGAGLTSLAVTYDKHADGSANFDQITLKGANGSTITNVKAGAVSATSTDAVNGAQLHGVSQSVAKSLGGGASVDADGNVTNPSYKVSDKTFDNVGDAIENISNSLVHGSIGLVQQDDTTREITVAKDTDGTTVNFEGTAGARVLTGVGAGAVSATSNDAINGSQLHGTAQSVADAIGGGTTVDADGKLADTSIEVNGNKYKTVAEAVQAAAQYGATDSLAVRYDLNADGTPNYGSVTLGGTGAAPVRVTNVADGASKYDAVNFGQLSELNDKIGGLDDRVGALEQNPGTGNPNPGGPGNEYFAGTDIGSDGTTPANAGDGTGNTAAGSNARVSTGVSNGTAIGSGAGVSKDGGVAIGSNAASAAEGAVAIGRGSDASGSKSSAIGDGAKATGANSVALGSGSQASEANTVSFGNGTDDGNRRIVNIRDGINETDAATKGQLDRAVGGLQGQVNDLSRNAYSGIAAATALTMIPGVDPGKTVSFGIGGATYKGYQAVAFGGEARITQNLKMKAGVGMSSGGNTVGVGASYQW